MPVASITANAKVCGEHHEPIEDRVRAERIVLICPLASPSPGTAK